MPQQEQLEHVSTESEQIVTCIKRILDSIRCIKPQLVCFYRSINLEVLGLQIKQLCSLLRSDSDSRAVKQDKTDHSPPPGQDSLLSVCRTKFLVKKPTVYKIIRPTRYDSGKAHKTYGRAKVNVGDNIVQENIQGVVNSATAIRVDITHATKVLFVLEDLIRMLYRKYCKRRKTDIKVPNQTEVQATNNSHEISQVRRSFGSLSEYVTRINSRRHMDRILINLRRRSTANSLIYLIDQERHKKSPWRL
ncbi:hypothetical protein CRM22_009604 [Opisthorchis felineus]|uniref:Uncharacterized protein n=1 Tax=Opisthorchis felineus TaxID=147828 RepID=A0A4S2LDZ3_OPIFE|nr:hypothetical protein CRM22_009604 [Opisthorchis felineus]